MIPSDVTVKMSGSVVKTGRGGKIGGFLLSVKEMFQLSSTNLNLIKSIKRDSCLPKARRNMHNFVRILSNFPQKCYLFYYF